MNRRKFMKATAIAAVVPVAFLEIQNTEAKTGMYGPYHSSANWQIPSISPLRYKLKDSTFVLMRFERKDGKPKYYPDIGFDDGRGELIRQRHKNNGEDSNEAFSLPSANQINHPDDAERDLPERPA